MNTTSISTMGKRLGLLMAATMLTCANANALTLKEAMAVAVESNPEIGQAIENREAIEFELRQAKGLYLPSVDLEASDGAWQTRNTGSSMRTGSDCRTDRRANWSSGAVM